MELIHTCYRITDPERLDGASTRRSASRSDASCRSARQATNYFFGVPGKAVRSSS